MATGNRHNTQAQFARWERSAKAGALAALVRAELANRDAGLTSEADAQAEVAVLMADADRAGVRDLVEQIVHDVPRLPPAKTAAELRYMTLDRLHRRVVALVVETGRLMATEKEKDSTRYRMLGGQQRDLAEESDALAAVLDEVLKAAHQERRDAEEDAADRARAQETRASDAVDDAVDMAKAELPFVAEGGQ